MKGGAVLIDFSDIFMTDFAQLNLGMLDRSRSNWSKVKGFHDNMELEVEATFAAAAAAGVPGRPGRRGRPPRHHRGDPLQPDEDPRLRLPPAHRRRPRRPLPERDQGFRRHRRRFELRPHDQPLAAREGQSRRQALAAQASRSSGTSRTPCRSSTAPTSRKASASGTRRSRRSASRTRSPFAGKSPAATTSTPKTPTTARSAGSPATWAARCRACGPTRSPAR